MQYSGNLVGVNAEIVNLPPTYPKPDTSTIPPPKDGEGNIKYETNSSKKYSDYTGYTLATGDSVTVIEGAKGSWTYGDSYSYTSGNTFSEFCGQKKDTTHAWTQSYFLGGKFDCTCGVSLSFKLGADSAFSLAPKLEATLAPLNTSFKTGAGVSYTLLEDQKFGPQSKRWYLSAEKVAAESSEKTATKALVAAYMSNNIATMETVAALYMETVEMCNEKYAKLNTITAMQTTQSIQQTQINTLYNVRAGLVMFGS